MQKIIDKEISHKGPHIGRFNILRSTAALRGVVIIVFACIGCLMLVISHAAQPAISAEAEKGKLTGTSIISDSKASGGHAVKFGNSKPASGSTGSTTPVSLGRFGMALGGSYQTFSTAELNKNFADMEAMGVQWVRFDIAWNDIQSGGSSSYNWGPYDNVVNAARQHNLKILGILDFAPTWAQQPSCAGQFACPPNGTSSFATYVTAAVNHYKPLGVSYWEIWNEPNITNFWLTPSPSAYTALLKAAYTAIKKVDSSATVISAGLAPAATDGTNYEQYDFIKGMYAAGAHGSFDALGDHPYCYSDQAGCLGTPDGNEWWQMAQTSQNIRQLMVANGDSSKKIWMTEFGAPTNVYTEAQQAQMMQQAYTLAASYSWAGPLFWYTYQDGGTDKTNVEDWFGVLRADGSQKPAYTTYKQLTGK